MNKRKGSIIRVLILIVFILYFCHVIIEQQKIINNKLRALKEIEDKIREEELLREELQKEKEMLSSEEYIEKIARKKLGLVKPGEKIFIDVNK
ncbi:MAG TPA: septum formation initiator family protein [Clostridiaceae bacterium]|nr:septum formation initiator family protein [Clostridiaceae bacterium]